MTHNVILALVILLGCQRSELNAAPTIKYVYLFGDPNSSYDIFLKSNNCAKSSATSKQKSSRESHALTLPIQSPTDKTVGNTQSAEESHAMASLIKFPTDKKIKVLPRSKNGAKTSHFKSTSSEMGSTVEKQSHYERNAKAASFPSTAGSSNSILSKFKNLQFDKHNVTIQQLIHEDNLLTTQLQLTTDSTLVTFIDLKTMFPPVTTETIIEDLSAHTSHELLIPLKKTTNNSSESAIEKSPISKMNKLTTSFQLTTGNSSASTNNALLIDKRNLLTTPTFTSTSHNAFEPQSMTDKDALSMPFQSTTVNTTESTIQDLLFNENTLMMATARIPNAKPTIRSQRTVENGTFSRTQFHFNKTSTYLPIIEDLLSNKREELTTPLLSITGSTVGTGIKIEATNKNPSLKPLINLGSDSATTKNRPIDKNNLSSKHNSSGPSLTIDEVNTLVIPTKSGYALSTTESLQNGENDDVTTPLTIPITNKGIESKIKDLPSPLASAAGTNVKSTMRSLQNDENDLTTPLTIPIANKGIESKIKDLTSPLASAAGTNVKSTKENLMPDVTNNSTILTTGKTDNLPKDKNNQLTTPVPSTIRNISITSLSSKGNALETVSASTLDLPASGMMTGLVTPDKVKTKHTTLTTESIPPTKKTVFNGLEIPLFPPLSVKTNNTISTTTGSTLRKQPIHIISKKRHIRNMRRKPNKRIHHRYHRRKSYRPRGIRKHVWHRPHKFHRYRNYYVRSHSIRKHPRTIKITKSKKHANHNTVTTKHKNIRIKKSIR